MRIIEYLKLIRVYQWYKNLLIFLPLIFVGSLFHIGMLEETAIGFIALCLISSSNYVLNDIIDVHKDRAHPEKKNRPLASGKITSAEAILIFIIVFFLSLYIAYSINLAFMVIVLLLFVLTLVYSLWLKNEPILDVIMIAIFFVLRSVSGAFIIKVFISPWIILCPFFLAIFLAVGKREADLRFMKDKAHAHKEVLKYYTLELTNILMIISTTCLIIAYSLYVVSRNTFLLISLPFAIYVILRFYYLVNTGSEIARHPEKVYKDWRMLLFIIGWIAIVVLVLYTADKNHIAGLLVR